MTYIDLNDNNYNDLLNHILKECDEISFHFPLLNEDDYCTGELADDYKKYMEAKQCFVNELMKHGAKQNESGVYQEIKLGYQTQIFRVKLYPGIINKLQQHHLYEWLWWNGLPEDPCFFEKGKCRFGTISHEEIFYVCDPSKDHSFIEKSK